MWIYFWNEPEWKFTILTVAFNILLLSASFFQTHSIGS